MYRVFNNDCTPLHSQNQQNISKTFSMLQLSKQSYITVQSFRLMCIVELKKYKLLTDDLLRFVSHVHDDVRADVRGLLIFLYRIVDIIISVTKQMEAAEANVCRWGLQNDNEELRVIHRAMAVAFRMARDARAAFITKNWVAVQLKRSAHFGQRKWHAVHMIFRQNFVVPATGSLSRKSRYCGSELQLSFGTGWMLLLLLLVATRVITNL